MPRGKQAYWLSEEGLALIRGWAREGLAEKSIAQKMSIAQITLSRWKEAHEEVKNALNAGKDATDFAVENALYKKAISGDTRAMVFWLKNRKPHVWRDKPIEALQEENEEDMLSEALVNLADHMDGEEDGDDGIA